MGYGDRRNAALGGFGERAAAAHYRAHGYAVLERNWRCPVGEIDLICARGTTLVVCEVKARTGSAHGHPLEAVTAPSSAGSAASPRRTCGSRGDGGPRSASTWSAVLDGTLEVVEGAF